jgi:site-specific DNA recombinase
MDFSKLVEAFERHLGHLRQRHAELSAPPPRWGRLTLNILLSFAQFEREVTAERSATSSAPPA